jgi:hypothetical protein
MKVFNRDRSRSDIHARVGRIDQVASATLVSEDEGASRGMRRILVRCGEIAFDVHPDRAMDIGALSFRGVPLAWTSPAGLSSPDTRGSSPMAWLESFSGGLIATCGLDSFGSPSEDNGEQFPLHGRIGTQRADHLSHRGSWTDDGDYEIRISGRVTQARLFGEALELRRTIQVRLGAARVDVHDVVTNLGANPQPHMILYHINLGWPLVDEAATLHIPSHEVVARDREAEAGIGDWHTFDAPSVTYAEQVFRHRLEPNQAVGAIVRNEELGFQLEVSHHTSQLPHLFQWKMLGSGAYVLGLEPANCPVIEGRATARSKGALPELAPGESRDYSLSFDLQPLP